MSVSQWLLDDANARLAAQGCDPIDSRQVLALISALGLLLGRTVLWGKRLPEHPRL